MTKVLEAVILGIIQGIAEFLPISSTGHLIIAENLLGVSQKTFGLSFDVALHVGTTTALIILFRKDIIEVLQKSWKNHFPSPLLLALIIGTVPAGIVGLLFETFIKEKFRSPELVAISLFIFSGLLLLGDYLTKKTKKRNKIDSKHALIIGLFQSIAVIPGVSRSGSTITGGLLLGHNREQSARFAFLLSIPIILLAGAKQTVDIAISPVVLSATEIQFFMIGFITATIVAFIVVKWFLRFFQAHGFLPFIIYRLSLSAIILLFIH